MTQTSGIKNITSTMAIFGATCLIAGSFSSTNSNLSIHDIKGLYKEYNGYGFKSNNTILDTETEFVLQTFKGNEMNLDKVAYDTFGQMREATIEERNGVRNYIESISESTGVNFFDLC